VSRKVENELCKNILSHQFRVRSYEPIPISFLAIKSKREYARRSINIMYPKKMKKIL
jgi:hypothetical protein